ncbi:MAG TPA: serine hydrolase, partial [Cytophagales bacterium]|nr:serine hydrolase [Cytophagales bacterium]
MKYLIILAVLLSILGCQAPQKSPPRQPFMEALDSALQAERVPGCAVMVIREGAVLLEEYSGEAEVSFAQPVTERTVFSINSIAKVFAGTTVMQLADRGMIQLQDSLGAYLDSLPASWQGITLRQLLNHTSGLPDIEDVAAGGVIGGQGEAHVWELVKQQPLVGTPG